MGLVIKAELARRRAALSCNASQMSPFLVMRSFLQILLTVGCLSSRDAGLRFRFLILIGIFF